MLERLRNLDFHQFKVFLCYNESQVGRANRSVDGGAEMSRAERVILTNMCMVYDGDRILVQNKVNDDWTGLCFPGGHVEHRESFVKSVIREVKEETGLTIYEPRLCGVKQFYTEKDERYIVFLYKTNRFEGELV